MTIIRNIALAGAIGFSLVACQNSETNAPKTGEVFRVDEIPHAQYENGS